MGVTNRLHVTEGVWSELSDLKSSEETHSQLPQEMTEREKQSELICHLKKIADEGDFVELLP